ncbi:hypothetical protein H4R19_001412 [Coemansia spiralis]|nr:hypothetical protein H4R19_001412 [Coemansia spiralis]
MSAAKAKVSAEARGELLALEALNQIVEEGQARGFLECPLRLDIGIAVGKDLVVKSRCRWWTLVPDNTKRVFQPSIDIFRYKGEKTKDWVQRMNNEDRTKWQDGLGWIRSLSPTDVRGA